MENENIELLENENTDEVTKETDDKEVLNDTVKQYIVVNLGDEFFGQKVKWNDWFAFVICYPVVLINSIINFVFKTIKHIRKK